MGNLFFGCLVLWGVYVFLKNINSPIAWGLALFLGWALVAAIWPSFMGPAFVIMIGLIALAAKFVGKIPPLIEDKPHGHDGGHH